MDNYSNYIKNLVNKLSQNKFEKSFDEPKISVIIPAYNIEDYIATCLFSIINQSFKDIEILVIDDGSKDKTAEIVEIFGQFDKRIKLIKQENQGAGNAKNNALKLAVGKYIMFVDSDDCLENNAIEIAYDTIFNQKAEVVVFGANGILDEKKVKCLYGIERTPKNILNKIVTQSEIYKNIFKLPVVAMCKIYDTSFLKNNNILFQGTKTGEDQFFHIKTILLAKRVFVLGKNLYCYRKKRKNSLTFSKRKNENSVIYNFYAIEEFLKNENLPNTVKLKILNKYFVKCVSWLGKCAENYRIEYFNDLEKFCTFVSQNHPEIYNNELKFSNNDTYFVLKIKLLFIKLKKKLCK